MSPDIYFAAVSRWLRQRQPFRSLDASKKPSEFVCLLFHAQLVPEMPEQPQIGHLKTSFEIISARPAFTRGRVIELIFVFWGRADFSELKPPLASNVKPPRCRWQIAIW
jgi:hypothetical protein